MSKFNPADGMEKGGRVVMTEHGYLAKAGSTGTLINDDASHAPKFQWDSGVESYEHLKNMKPLRLNDTKPSEWDEAAKATTKPVTMPKPVKDTVDSPAHYNNGGIECIAYIRQQLGEEGYIAYCEGNVLKYQHRYKYKGGLEDLKKARKYQEWLIEAVEAKDAVAMDIMKKRNV
jgi:hypothetical protein